MKTLAPMLLLLAAAGCAAGPDAPAGIGVRIDEVSEAGVAANARHMKLGPMAAAVLAGQVAATPGLRLVLPAGRIDQARTSWELLAEKPDTILAVEEGDGDASVGGEVKTEGGELVAVLRLLRGGETREVQARAPLGSGERNKLLFRELALRLICLLAPEDARVPVRLGIALREQGLVKEAIEAYARALRIQPGYAAAHYNMGVAYDAGGDVTNAVKCYRRAVEADPLHARAQYNWALDELREREPGETEEAFSARARQAEELLGQALESAPRMRDAHFLRVEALRIQGKPAEALEEARRMQRVFPGDGRVHEVLGCLLLSLGRHAEAAAEFEKAQDLEPGLLSTLYFLGLALEGGGRKAEAALQYETFLGLTGADAKFEKPRQDAQRRLEALRAAPPQGGKTEEKR
ncbi:MAG: tetratricopeptide repeat protein [Planctomycetes bacterium]|jgi:tetratricopeptide (TPR) repeat protein|nr:tetratricopeptide repeat protein [Planctomycetota bacterium]